MQAIIFSLTTFGHIDGDFDDSEKEFVREYIKKPVAQRAETGLPDAHALHPAACGDAVPLPRIAGED